MDNRDHWRVFCPRLHVEGDLDRVAHRFDRLEDLLRDLRVEGYVNVPHALPLRNAPLQSITPPRGPCSSGSRTATS